MKQEDFKQSVDAKIGELQQQLAKLKVFRAGLDDPEIAALLVSSNGHPVRGASSGKSRPIHREGSAFTRMCEFFRANGNNWASQRELINVLQVSKNSVSTVLYSRNVDDFEKRTSAEGVNQWRLKPENAV